jgi:hypothetical protein
MESFSLRPWRAVLCKLCGYKLFVFAVSSFKSKRAKAFNREDRKGNAKIAEKTDQF